ncbi:MAG: hypothetical protein J1E95_04330 [Muribaculaceae bacterium]|nr:hypothetical protein [Muribaculaceae bacterium]
MEKKFKCKDEVIFQNKVHFGDEKLIWNYGIVNYEDEGYVYLVGGLYINKKLFKILPYEGNEHLVGTTDEPDEEIRLEEGEWIIPADIIGVYENVVNCLIRQFDYVDGGLFKCKNSTVWHFAIPFKEFDPSNMEETKKHILCVKNGKIVRYKN